MIQEKVLNTDVIFLDFAKAFAKVDEESCATNWDLQQNQENLVPGYMHSCQDDPNL